MPRAPAFWQQDTLLSRLLSPLGAITRAITARRVARTGWQAPVPVICCGNVTVGGAGKTTMAIDLLRRLRAAGQTPHALLRGHGGASRGVHRVVPGDDAATVGDEALLLVREAPTWIGADRAASGAAAVAAGASVLVMDDGLQNPTLRKDLSLLVIDGATGFGNGRLLPAGPLREDVASAARRCQAAVLIGDDATAALMRLPGGPTTARHQGMLQGSDEGSVKARPGGMSPGMVVLRARLVQDASITSLRGQRVLAFAGIARPSKFFAPLAEAGAIVVHAEPFPDHHPFTRRELQRLLARAEACGAIPVTTPKDAERLPPDIRARVTVIGVSLAWETPEVLDTLLRETMGRPAPLPTGGQ